MALRPLRAGVDHAVEYVERDLALLSRILRRIQSPPNGGKASDIREWVEEVVDARGQSLGIVRGFIYPKRNGAGSSDAHCHGSSVAARGRALARQQLGV